MYSAMVVSVPMGSSSEKVILRDGTRHVTVASRSLEKTASRSPEPGAYEMNRDSFRRVESEEELVALLKRHTESTGVSIGGNLRIGHLFSQCSVDVRGEEATEFDEAVTLAQLESLGLTVAGHDAPGDVIEAYFDERQA